MDGHFVVSSLGIFCMEILLFSHLCLSLYKWVYSCWVFTWVWGHRTYMCLASLQVVYQFKFLPIVELGSFEWLLLIKYDSVFTVITLKASSLAECSIKGCSMWALVLLTMAENRVRPEVCVRSYTAIRAMHFCFCFMAWYTLMAALNTCGFLFLMFSWKLKRVWKQPDSYRPHK